MRPIERLFYDIQLPRELRLDSPPPLDHTEPQFQLRFAGSQAEVRLTANCATVDEAQQLVEPWLKAYAIHDALQARGRPELRFTLRRAELSGGEEADISRRGVIIGAHIEVPSAPLSAYSQPPAAFCVSPDLDTLWRRFQNYRKGREPLASMANLALTVLESRAPVPKNRRRLAARLFGIDPEILRELGRFTATRGSRAARKADGLQSDPYSSAEIRWIEAAVLRILGRLGEHEAGASGLPTIRMQDL